MSPEQQALIKRVITDMYNASDYAEEEAILAQLLDRTMDVSYKQGWKDALAKASTAVKESFKRPF